MGWQLEGVAIVHAWLDQSPHAAGQADAVLGWIAGLLANPDDTPGTPLPGKRPGTLAANVEGTDVWVTWLVVDQYRVVRILEIAP